MEVYYERLLKLANSLQHKTIDSFLTVIFISELQPHLCVTTTGMKRETLQQHKEATLIYEEGISEVKAINNLSIPQNSSKTSNNPKENKNVLYKLSHDKKITLKHVESKERKNLFL